jgi:hypothetical protein
MNSKVLHNHFIKWTLLVVLSMMCLLVSQTSMAQTFRGNNKISLQWISWDYFGQIRGDQNGDGSWSVSGGQESRSNGDYLRMDGNLSHLGDPNVLYFQGAIVTRISHIASGQPCIRRGDFTFRKTSGRKYWRLQEMKNPCDGVTDYIDIYQ